MFDPASIVLAMLNGNEITEDNAIKLLDIGKTVIYKDSPVLTLQSPITVIGDIHGQFFDLIAMLKQNGLPPDRTLLFLGDLVDRGRFSIETLCTIIGLKICYPENVYILRGNHESRRINDQYGFMTEVISRFQSIAFWEIANELFDFFPVVALIDFNFFCVHGGITKNLGIEDLFEYQRGIDIDASPLLEQITWSDPMDEEGCKPNPRGSGSLFGPDVTEQFCHNNNINVIIRAHQYAQDGFNFCHDGHVITIFSAPNYMYEKNNFGAYVLISGSNFQPVQFSSMPDECRKIIQRDPL